MLLSSDITKESILDLFGIKSVFYNEYINQSKQLFAQDSSKNTKVFNQWKLQFGEIYGSKNVENIELYLNQTYLFLILKIFYLKTVKIDDDKYIEAIFSTSEFENFSPGLESFSWIFPYFIGLKNFVNKIWDKLKTFTSYVQEDLFEDIYQEIISSSIRHGLGEFYTPNWLVNLLIAESAFKPGESAIDPTCGSGIFILGLIKNILKSNLEETEKVSAINRVYGLDINPLAVACTKVNCFILLTPFFKKKEINFSNFRLKDCLKEKFEDLQFDLIIGNPPWLTYKDLSIEKQQEILDLAKFYKINPESKNVANLEISSIFFYRVSTEFLKKNGRIMFLTTSGLLNGGHASKFRNFIGYKNVILYLIKDNAFPTSSIAWFNVKDESTFFEKNDKILTKIIKKRRIESETYMYPLYKDNIHVGKLISLEDKNKVKKIGASEYKKSCNRGFSAFPRIFYFISKDKNGIKVDKEISRRSKGYWKENSAKILKKLDKFYEKHSIDLEENIFPILLSRKFESFHVKEYSHVILPLKRNLSEKKYDFIDITDKNSSIIQYYDIVNGFWKESESSKKAQVNTIFKRLNYQNDLLKDSMFQPIKVVYNEAGSKLKSVVINEDHNILMDITVYYISTSDLNEAHFLCSIFNSDSFNMKLKIIKSDRHFHKRPVSEIPIPKYVKSNKNHASLSELSKKCHELRASDKSIDDVMQEINELIELIL